MLEVINLTKSYGQESSRAKVLTNVSFELTAGSSIALEGESGSGKSTVLHLIAGLDHADGGTIKIDGSDVTGITDAQSAALRRTTVGVIFQQFNLIPSLAVRANIDFHARLGKRHNAEWTTAITQKLGLTEHVDKYPEALSGGQQQRVAIARTLAARPRLILADEPTGNLDEATADSVLALLLECAKDAGAAVLMVTHSPRLAARMDRRLLLSHGTVQDVANTEVIG